MMKRNRNVRRLVLASVFAMAFQTIAMGQPRGGNDGRPAVPVNLQVPPGHSLYLKAYAVGTQNYVCLPSGWSFLGPQATLFMTFPWRDGNSGVQIATHFLSSNPMEGGMSRPSWQGSLDTGAVWAKSIANSTDPNFVAPGAIPWLLLEVVGSQRGPTDGATLTITSFIQRVNTSGGVAPTSACTVGSTALVPYTTDYYFFKPDR
jgi:hypothetical protein